MDFGSGLLTMIVRGLVSRPPEGSLPPGGPTLREGRPAQGMRVFVPRTPGPGSICDQHSARSGAQLLTTLVPATTTRYSASIGVAMARFCVKLPMTMPLAPFTVLTA